MKIGSLTVSVGEKIDTIDGVWAEYECGYWGPDEVEHEGFIQGDGHLFAPETLVDENGNPIMED